MSDGKAPLSVDLASAAERPFDNEPEFSMVLAWSDRARLLENIVERLKPLSKKLHDRGTGADPEHPLPACPKCGPEATVGSPLAIDYENRYDTLEDVDLDPKRFDSMVCRACGTAWLEQDARAVYNAWVAWGIWEALGAAGLA